MSTRPPTAEKPVKPAKPSKLAAPASAPAGSTPAPASRTRGPGTRRSGLGAKHDDKRTAILRTAAQLFAEKGYESTSLDNIAERLGMHKATLYHYVANKESILYQCLVFSFGDLDKEIEATQDRSVPVLERLRAFVRSLSVAQNNDFGRCLVLVGARPLETQGGDIRQFQRRLDSTVRALITEGIADGTIKPCNPSMFSAVLFGALNWVPRWHNENGKLSIPQVADTFMDMLIDGIAARR
jgi:AcrR family transcriptional regulator